MVHILAARLSRDFPFPDLQGDRHLEYISKPRDCFCDFFALFFVLFTFLALFSAYIFEQALIQLIGTFSCLYSSNKPLSNLLALFHART